jgi:hypothetical protein
MNSIFYAFVVCLSVENKRYYYYYYYFEFGGPVKIYPGKDLESEQKEFTPSSPSPPPTMGTMK